LAEEWRERSLVLGRLIRVERGDDRFVGRAVEIRADGSLVVASESDTHVIGSGSISFVV
jgi:biotin-(acetyl-CoA carboxylase) ligase